MFLTIFETKERPSLTLFPSCLPVVMLRWSPLGDESTKNIATTTPTLQGVEPVGDGQLLMRRGAEGSDERSGDTIKRERATIIA